MHQPGNRSPMPGDPISDGSKRSWSAAAVWRVRLLGAVRAEGGNRHITHFPSRAAALLLARLALAPTRDHPREELVECLWPGVALDVGRNRLRQTLSTLKALLEPTDGTGAVLQADRQCIRVAPGALACDVLELQAALRAGLPPPVPGAGGTAGTDAEFMPGYYEDWVQLERQRLVALLERPPAAPPQTPAAGQSAAARQPLQPPLQPPLPGAPARHLQAHAADPLALQPPHPAAALRPLPYTTRAEPSPAIVRLPRYLTTLFGAEPALTLLGAVLLEQRLVTVLGPGGAGKTRLAVEAAGRTAGSSEGPALDRVVFVPLVPCTSRADVLGALASALHQPPATATDCARMAQALVGLPSLLLLDNCEQLSDDAVNAIGELLALVPTLQVLATSRRVLGLDGEHTVDLHPLPLPAPSPTTSPITSPTAASQAAPTNRAADNPAVALFVDRARAARADFRLGPRQASVVADLVRALGGLPLAIELAACRVRSYSPQEMLQTLAGGEAAAALDLLARSGPRSGHDSRHASMRRVVAWSWQLLAPEQQHLLAGLSLFVSPFTAEAARAVQTTGDVHLALDSLVAHSMLRTEPGETTRFALHEPVRDFARLQLEHSHSADECRSLRQRLRHGLLRWAQALPPGTPLLQIQNELMQLRSLLHSAAEDQACGLVLQVVLALRLWWDSDGMSVPDIEAIETALQQWPAPEDPSLAAAPPEPSDNSAQRADVHELLAYLRFGAGHGQAARAHAQQALHWAGRATAPRARALLRQAWIELASGHTHPELQTSLQTSLQEALDLAQTSGDRATQARALHQLAVLELTNSQNLQIADALLKRAQDLWLQLGYSALASARQRSRAELLHRQRRWEEAIATYDECEQRALDSGDWVGVMDSALLRGMARAGQRRWADAAQSLALCTQVAWQRHHAHGLAYGLWYQARMLARLRQAQAAAQLLGFAQRYWCEHIGPLNTEYTRQMHRVQALVAALAGRRAAQQWVAQGAALTTAQAVALAVAGGGGGTENAPSHHAAGHA